MSTEYKEVSRKEAGTLLALGVHIQYKNGMYDLWHSDSQAELNSYWPYLRKSKHVLFRVAVE